MIRSVVFRHPGEECLHAPLERVILLDIVGIPDPGGIDDAIQDHPPHPVREKGGVNLADIGAVGERVIVDFRHAERRADGIHVAGHVLGRHIGQQPAEPSAAIGGVGFRPVDEHLLGGGTGRDVVRPQAGEEAGIAAERGHRGPDAARVEADDVVLGGHARAEALRHLGRERQPGAAGAARVDQQDPLLLALRRGGRDHVQGQADVPAAGLGVVDRDAQHGAVRHALLAQLARAGMPVQRAVPRDEPARSPAARRRLARRRLACSRRPAWAWLDDESPAEQAPTPSSAVTVSTAAVAQPVRPLCGLQPGGRPRVRSTCPPSCPTGSGAPPGAGAVSYR